MRFRVYRYNPETDSAPRMQDFEVDARPGMMLHDALMDIQRQDESFSFRHSCGEGVCGSDAVNRAGGETARRLPLWGGFALGLGLLLGITLPEALTRIGLHMAAADDPAESTRGVRLLRWVGKGELLLRACYGRAGRSGELYRWGRPIAPETARFVYYRVHGEPFNAVPPPKLYVGRARWELMEQEFTWDDDQGGDSVAGRVRGLGLVHSRQDAVIEPEAALAYI